jgi:uncharacterized membrane protein YoaK (UPF0700 family)
VSATSIDTVAADAAHRRERLDSCTLSFVAGFVDTCVFVGLFGLFTAHVTGNLVLIGAALVHQTSEVLAKLLALPVFVLAVACAVRAADALKRAGRGRLAPLLCAEAVLLLCSVATITASAPPATADAPVAIVAGLFAASAMGLQNALMRLELAAVPSSTVMTVNVTQAAIDATILASRDRDAADARRRDETRKRFARMWPPILAFTVGAACGAIGYAWLGLASLVLPAVLCFALALRFARARVEAP